MGFKQATNPSKTYHINKWEISPLPKTFHYMSFIFVEGFQVSSHACFNFSQ
jgi:hypothetical protein